MTVVQLGERVECVVPSRKLPNDVLPCVEAM